jgi:hypothetical protein
LLKSLPCPQQRSSAETQIEIVNAAAIVRPAARRDETRKRIV